MDDKELEKAFVEMIYKYGKVIYKVCSFYMSKEYALADLYQETVYNLWKGYTKFRGNSSESTWIYRIALNTCISRLRKEKNKPEKSSISIFDNLFEETDNMQENIEEMYQLIRRLKTLERAIVLLYLEEKSYQEIADITGLTLCNVATKLKRIKLKLKKMSEQ